MSYILYVIGFVIVIGGLIYGAALLHVPCTMDCCVFSCTAGYCDFDGRQSDAAKGSE